MHDWAQGRDGHEALFWAIRKGDDSTMFHIHFGADLNMKDGCGQATLIYACNMVTVRSSRLIDKGLT
jgi:hypothetical protein